MFFCSASMLLLCKRKEKYALHLLKEGVGGWFNTDSKPVKTFIGQDNDLQATVVIC